MCTHARMHVCVLQVLQLSFRIYMGQKRYHDAMRVALRLNEMPLIEQSFGGWRNTCGRVEWVGAAARGRVPAGRWHACGRRQGRTSV